MRGGTHRFTTRESPPPHPSYKTGSKDLSLSGVQGQSPWPSFPPMPHRMTPARDELLDAEGRLSRPWRRMLGTLLGMGVATLRTRAAELNRALAEEGAAAVMAAPGSMPWRCDPVPFLLTEAEFSRLAFGLAQRARLLEAVLADVYGPRDLLRAGLLPPALVYPSSQYLRPCRMGMGGRHLTLYAADVLRAPDGSWQVMADHTAEPAGLAHVLEKPAHDGARAAGHVPQHGGGADPPVFSIRGKMRCSGWRHPGAARGWPC